MIKNFRELSKIEKKSLYQSYYEYFISLDLQNIHNPLMQKYYEIFNKSLSELYARKMMANLEGGSSFGFVNTQNDAVNAFITGKEYPDKIGWISHFYESSSIIGTEKEQIRLELYKTMCNELSKRGMTSVDTEVSYFDALLCNALVEMGFNPDEVYSDYNVKYKKGL